MSTAGQAIGGVIGAVVGFFTPIGPLYSAELEMMAGNFIEPQQRGEDCSYQSTNPAECQESAP